MLNIPNNCLTLIDSECVTQYICTIQAQSVLCLYTESVTQCTHWPRAQVRGRGGGGQGGLEFGQGTVSNKVGVR